MNDVQSQTKTEKLFVMMKSRTATMHDMLLMLFTCHRHSVAVSIESYVASS